MADLHFETWRSCYGWTRVSNIYQASEVRNRYLMLFVMFSKFYCTLIKWNDAQMACIGHNTDSSFILGFNQNWSLKWKQMIQLKKLN